MDQQRTGKRRLTSCGIQPLGSGGFDLVSCRLHGQEEPGSEVVREKTTVRQPLRWRTIWE
jgi:hypothetical protein